MVERSPFELLGGDLEVYRLLKKILVLSVGYEILVMDEKQRDALWNMICV